MEIWASGGAVDTGMVQENKGEGYPASSRPCRGKFVLLRSREIVGSETMRH
ncbi:hypothetical protein ZHAS_00018846 [Anopheles sinensis]|uniref:Uncharacterized protein n=1 Tax=Anopheles sinensis TaxID=74873 RepID=A0A084WKQ1_ANOSI|nr:hypothetical protein ZHAS_00018846 [Anopheles sinensis]